MKKLFEYMLDKHFMLTIFTVVLVLSTILGSLSLLSVATFQFILAVVLSATVVYCAS
jgi:uncharacterized membrane protein YcaP (DUF421 family)